MLAAVRVADPVAAYAEAVAAKDVLAGPWVRQAAARHLRDLEDGHRRELSWDGDEAMRAIEFFSHLRLFEGEFSGRPFTLQPWQQFIVGSLFGWKMTDGTRRFRTAYIEAAKGNGKTPLADGIGLKGLLADDEDGAEIYTAGVTREQASYLLTDMSRMVAASPQLERRLDVTAHNIAHHPSGSYVRPVSSEGRSLDQKRVHMALIDEIHEHPTDIVVSKMRAGTKGRRNALIFLITNAGYDRTSVCWQLHELSLKVLDGTVENDSWFAFVCGLDEGDEWTDEAVWPKANPNLGVSITHRYLREQVAEAIEMPAKQNLVKRLNFCIWTEAATSAFDMEAWDACSDPPTIADSQQIWAGLDLASTTDLTAFLELGVDEDGVVSVIPHFWCPEASIDLRSRRDHVPYRAWVDAELLTATPGNVTDYDIVRTDILELAATREMREIGYDRWNATQLITQLVNDGATCTPVGQGFASLSAPFKELIGLVAGRKLRHGGHPVLRWMAANCAAEQDAAGNVKPSKAKSSEHIDGIVALTMALARYIVDAQDDGPSVYEERGLVTIG